MRLFPKVIPGPSFALSPQSPWPSLPRDAQMLMEDVKRIVHELDQGQQLSSIGVELVDNELAILYMNSKKSEVNLLLFQLSLGLSLICAVSSSICCTGPAFCHLLPHVIHLVTDVLIFGFYLGFSEEISTSRCTK